MHIKIESWSFLQWSHCPPPLLMQQQLSIAREFPRHKRVVQGSGKSLTTVPTYSCHRQRQAWQARIIMHRSHTFAIPIHLCVVTAYLLNHSAFPDGQPLSGLYFFVCSHSSRDARCGACGPLLTCAISRAAAAMKIEAHAFMCSHVGGHDMAGNVIVFYKKASGEGLWRWIVRNQGRRGSGDRLVTIQTLCKK